MVTRTEIVEAARSFVCLPYDPGLPSKGFLIAVAQRLGLPYRDNSALRQKFKLNMLPGDVVVVRINATQLQNAILNCKLPIRSAVAGTQRARGAGAHVLGDEYATCDGCEFDATVRQPRSAGTLERRTRKQR